MAQFDLYENSNADTHQLYPYLLDVQADILADLPTRIVVPLILASEIKKPIPVLNPVLEIGQVPFVLSTPQMVGVSLNILGTKVCSLKDMRNLIIAALDLAFTGY